MYALVHRRSSRTLQESTANRKTVDSFLLAKFWVLFHFPFAKILLGFGKSVAFITLVPGVLTRCSLKNLP